MGAQISIRSTAAELSNYSPEREFLGSQKIGGTSVTVYRELLEIHQLHRKLRNAGVQTELNVFEGMWHVFWEKPELPESREAMTELASFFNRYLQ